MNNQVRLFLLLAIGTSVNLTIAGCGPCDETMNPTAIQFKKVPAYDSNHPCVKNQDLIQLDDAEKIIYADNATAVDYVSAIHILNATAAQKALDDYKRCCVVNNNTAVKHATDAPARLTPEANAIQQACFSDFSANMFKIFASKAAMLEVESSNKTFNYAAYLAIKAAEDKVKAEAEAAKAASVQEEVQN